MTKTLKASSAEPTSWWLLALALAVAAGASSEILVQFAIASFSVVMVLMLREEAPWSKSLGFYLALAGFVFAARVLFRIVFNSPNPNDPALFSLPALQFNLGFGPTVTLFGEIGQKALIYGATDGMRLAAIILAIAMANSLANPRRLLKSTPGALYEIASSVSVAINLAPQIISSLARVRQARELRGRSKGLGQMAGIVIPVLEDAIESSMALAASMDARGFGRSGALSRQELFASRIAALTSVVLILIGSFLLLIGSSQLISLVLIVIAIALSAISIRISSKAKIRTRLENINFGYLDYALVALSVAIISLTLLGVRA
ncbi:MAG: energy-coupling factor transporter transmembrane protein EcfT [Actinomycetota bacterium]